MKRTCLHTGTLESKSSKFHPTAKKATNFNLRKLVLFSFTLLMVFSVSAQTYNFSGVIKDRETGETLIGANILLGEGRGTITDFEGRFSIKLPAGDFQVQISYVGFEPIIRKISLSKDLYQVYSLEPQMLGEVSVVSDVARERETPVAFTNIKPAKIEEELGNRDLPMVLNSTPGVYATQQGGGDGDARVNIRGFNQRNVAVMLDGIPVNDMENGWVYWSNWFGLDMVTRTMQVQRGLSASKLTIPAVGGTMNIITKGIENKKETSIRQELDSEGRYRTSLAYTSGPLANGWGVTAAGSFKEGDGWADETWSKAYFYYLKVDKRVKNHILSFTAMGSPQSHGQRSYKRAVATYDTTYAASLGIDTLPRIINQGIRYNQHWGHLNRWELGDVVDSTYNIFTGAYTYAYDTLHNRERVSSTLNEYHKPMFSLRDFWTVSDKLYISNILYLSLGRGGGTGTKNSLKDEDLDEDGQINWQSFYDANRRTTGFSAIDLAYSPTLFKAGNYRVMNVNEHVWYGLLSTFNYQYSNEITFSGGIDVRSYKGRHYRKVFDLLGGDYAVDFFDANQDTAVKFVGDKVFFYNDAWVNWGGMFGQIEYSDGVWSFFGNASVAESAFKKEDYFRTPDDPQRMTDWLLKTSYTLKAGANYNLTARSNLFMNLGYLSRTRASNYIYDGYAARFRAETPNELVKAIEFGYSYASPTFSYNVNLYNTSWEDKPMNDIQIGQDLIARVNGINQLHQGVEVDFIYMLSKQLSFQGLASIGNWTYQSQFDSVPLFERNTEQQDGYINFDARGVHVGDAAQTQYMASLRYEPIKRLYINTSYIFFDRYYSDFSPSTLNGRGFAVNEDGSPRDSWRIPAYGLLDIHAGYTFFVKDYRMSFRVSVLNALNTVYISDALNNDQYIYQQSPNDFGASSASVFLGLGTRVNTSLSITF